VIRHEFSADAGNNPCGADAFSMHAQRPPFGADFWKKLGNTAVDRDWSSFALCRSESVCVYN